MSAAHESCIRRQNITAFASLCNPCGEVGELLGIENFLKQTVFPLKYSEMLFLSAGMF